MLKVRTLKPVEDMSAPEIILRGDIQTKNAEEKSNVQPKRMEEMQSVAVTADVAAYKKENKTDISKLVGKKQNIVIESYGGDEAVKDCITRLAVLLVKEDQLMKGFIRKLRSQYNEKRRAFSFSIAAWDDTDKKKLREIFSQELCGVVDSVDIESNPDIIAGNLVFSPVAINFLNGQYMEIGVYEIAKETMSEIATRCRISWDIYRNVVVKTKNGIIKNEFDVVIECEGMFYVVEVKSGENFDAWGNLIEAGKPYQIWPNRLLLVDSWLSDERASQIEEFCQYYVSNLEHDSLRKKILTMVTKDL